MLFSFSYGEVWLCEENFAHLHLGTQHPSPSLSPPPGLNVRPGGTPGNPELRIVERLPQPNLQLELIRKWIKKMLRNQGHTWPWKLNPMGRLREGDGFLSQARWFPAAMNLRDRARRTSKRWNKPAAISSHKELQGVCHHGNRQKGDMADVYWFLLMKP